HWWHFKKIFEAKLGTLFLPLCVLNWGCVFLDIGGTFLCNFEAKFGTLVLPLCVLNWDCVFLDIGGTFFSFFGNFEAKFGTLVLPLCVLTGIVFSWTLVALFFGNFEAKFGTLVLPLCELNWGCVLPLCELNWGCVFLGIGNFFLGKFETKLGTLFLPSCVLNGMLLVTSFPVVWEQNLVPSFSLPVWMCNEVEAFHQLSNQSLSSGQGSLEVPIV
ncbi:hypothetical protein H5410_001172, partial [Solanum commersonii]